MRRHYAAIVGALVLSASTCFAQSNLVEQFKQAFNQKAQAIKTDSVTERNVLFQDVRQTGKNANTYQFTVTALQRDYNAGQPKFKYYGTTCVRKWENQVFTMYRDAFGKWALDGMFTPSLDTQTCKDNPGAGVSSIPVDSLSGTPAAPGAPAVAQPADAGKLAAGKYECWNFSSPRPLLNFKVTSATSYTGSDGKAGAFTLDATTGKLAFTSGFLADAVPAGYHWQYHAPGGKPTASLRNSKNDEVSFCEWTP